MYYLRPPRVGHELALFREIQARHSKMKFWCWKLFPFLPHKNRENTWHKQESLAANLVCTRWQNICMTYGKIFNYGNTFSRRWARGRHLSEWLSNSTKSSAEVRLFFSIKKSAILGNFLLSRILKYILNIRNNIIIRNTKIILIFAENWRKLPRVGFWKDHSCD